jgi:hypothetical protein
VAFLQRFEAGCDGYAGTQGLKAADPLNRYDSAVDLSLYMARRLADIAGAWPAAAYVRPGVQWSGDANHG